jgi:phospholipase A1
LNYSIPTRVLVIGLSLFCILSAQAQTTAPSDQEDQSVLMARLATLKAEKDSPWIITPMRPNYIMPVTYSFDPNNKPLKEAGVDEKFDEVEVKFQISFILTLAEDLLWDNGDLNFAYSQVSFWNAYNSELSEPFRDTNYEPEMNVLFDTDYKVLGMTGRAVNLGFVHQSNGRGYEGVTRSWNRIYANAIFERGNFVLSVKPWYRLSEDDDEDENPNIERYVGYGEVRGFYKHENQVFSAMLRNNMKADDNKGAIELGWSFPLHNRLKGYVQYFNGYAESLLDYDETNQRVGLGVMLSDWL